jgi:DNA-binding transcriptional LysR family regulator
VLDGRVEIGLAEGAVEDPMLEQTLVGHDRLVIVAPTGHAWTKKPPRLGDLEKENWVLREPGSGTRSAFAAALAEKGVDAAKLKVSLELPSNEAVRIAVRDGAGVSALSELVAEAGVKFGAIQPVKFALPERPFHALRHRERYLSRSGLAFMDMARNA